jgi:hypothetical protein
MTIKDELLALQKKAPGGLLQVKSVHDWATANTDSCLYNSMTQWSDEECILKWRYQHIRELIAIHVVTEVGERKFVSLSIDRVRPGGGYRDMDAVMKAPRLRQILLQDALDDLERVRLKYHTVVELARVWEEAKRIREKHPKPEKGRKD